MKRLIYFLLLPLLLAMTCALPGGAATAKAKTPVQTGHVSDSQLDATIKAKLAKSKIGKDGLHFRVSNGTVTWEGTTTVAQHKGAATRMARTSGATQVINNIHVSGGASPGAPMKKAYVQP